MDKRVFLLLLTLGLCWSEGQPCTTRTDCAEMKCGARTLCLMGQCHCLYVRKERSILEGACVNNEECSERCRPTGLIFGRCLLDRCSCYTFPG